MDVHAAVQLARSRIAPHAKRTRLFHSTKLSAKLGCNVFLKCEHEQVTNSFKFRGALNRIRALAIDELSRGVVTASTGNHALAVSEALATCASGRAIIFLPSTANQGKVAKIEAYAPRVEIRQVGQTCDEAEAAGKRFAAENRMEWISPYNDRLVLAGQGTIGAEILEDAPDIDTVFIAVGGGGLVSGIGGYLRGAAEQGEKRVRVVGCQPANDAAMHASVKCGRIVEIESLPTLSDGTAGGIEPGSITFPIVQEVVDEFVLVSEDEIADAMRQLKCEEGMTVEGSAGVAYAALVKRAGALAGKNVAVLLCGGNVSEGVKSRVFGE